MDGSEERAHGPGPFLVVEDDFQMAYAIVRELERIRPIEVANSARAARKALMPWRCWSGLIVDIGLPDGSGIEVVRFARTGYPLLPILVLTGRNDRTVINEAHRLRAEFLCKPADSHELIAFCRRAITFERVPNERLAYVVDELARQYELTPREAELVAACMATTTRAQLATELKISDNTLKTQIRQLLRKLGCESLEVLSKRLLQLALSGSKSSPGGWP